MTVEEISDIIDTRLGTFDIGISVDEYEKSLYLTRAQNSIYDSLIKMFEINGDLSKDLEPFIAESIITIPLVRTPSIIANSIFFPLPATSRKVVAETAVLSHPTDLLLDGKLVKVIHVKLAEVSRKINSPFRIPNYEEIWRIVTSEETISTVVTPIAELVPPSGAGISSYTIKYIAKVTPIVLEDLPTGLDIEGVSLETNSKFNTEILNKIIDLAIGLILQDKSVTKSEV